MAKIARPIFLLILFSFLFDFEISSGKVKKQKFRSDANCRKGSGCHKSSSRECLSCLRFFRKGSSCVFDSAQCGDCLEGFSKVLDPKDSTITTCKRNNVVSPESQNNFTSPLQTPWQGVGVAAAIVIFLLFWGRKNLINIWRCLSSNLIRDNNFNFNLSLPPQLVSSGSGAVEGLSFTSPSDLLEPFLALNNKDKLMHLEEEVFTFRSLNVESLQGAKVFVKPFASYYLADDEGSESVDMPDGVPNSGVAQGNSNSEETSGVPNASNSGESSHGTQVSDETSHSSEEVVTTTPGTHRSSEENCD